MSSELQEKITQYNADLKEALTKLKEIELELHNKFESEGLTSAENKRYKKVKAIIEKIEKSLELTLTPNLIAATKESLEDLKDPKLDVVEIDLRIINIITNFEQLNLNNSSTIETTIEELKDDDVDKDFDLLPHKEKVIIIKNKISALEKKIKKCEEKNEIDDEFRVLLAKYEKLLKLLESQIDLKNAEKELESIPKAKTKAAKGKIINKYTKKLDIIEELSLEDIEKELEESTVLKEANKVIENKNILERAKGALSKKEKDEEKSSKVKKVITYITIIGCTIAICWSLTKCAAKDNKPKVEYTNGIDEDKQKIIDELVNNWGLDKITATQYAEAKGFDINNIVDYEAARTKFNITPANAVDYVNRAYKIQATNFFEGADLIQVVDILRAIDEKELFTTDNANLAQAFNTSFNGITNNYLFGTVTEADIKKIDALNHIGKDNSEVDNFSTGYAERLKAVLQNPNSDEAKEKMYNYIVTFTLNVNGFENEDPDFAVSEKPESAIVKDYFNWYMLDESIAKTGVPFFYTEKNAQKVEDLQIIGESIKQDPAYEAFRDEICGPTRVIK